MPQPSPSPAPGDFVVIPASHRPYRHPADYLIARPGQPAALVQVLVLLSVALAVACLIVAWRRTARGGTAKGGGGTFASLAGAWRWWLSRRS